MKSKNQLLTKLLVAYANQKDKTLLSIVSEDALNAYDAEKYLYDVVYFGCVSGIVNHLVYYADAHQFFEKYYYEINELFNGVEDLDTVLILMQDDVKTTLAWFAYENIARDLLNVIEGLP